MYIIASNLLVATCHHPHHGRSIVQGITHRSTAIGPFAEQQQIITILAPLKQQQQRQKQQRHITQQQQYSKQC